MTAAPVDAPQAAAGRETPDIETSSEAYARRFAGPVGAWFLEVQARTTLALLRRTPNASVLDVGGGHAQLTQALVEAGHVVTVLGSDPVCATRLRRWREAGTVRFIAGDLIASPWVAGSFDIVLAFRVLPHVARWERLVAELARVARGTIVVDYPTRRSVNALADAFFGWKQRIERDTRPFTVFRDSELKGAFAACGFRPWARQPQFFWPMALHRGLGAAGLSRALERAASLLGLTRTLGSPVILALERQPKSRQAR
jgi:SAM-dependent methyltransferase